MHHVSVSRVTTMFSCCNTVGGAYVLKMALKGLQVLELAGLAPVPFAGLILADFGATVVSVARVGQPSIDTLSRNKSSLAVNLKDKRGIGIVSRLSSKSDVLLEPYRPGVMERLGLGPEVLMKDNPRLIYARLTGYGQYGPLLQRAGHDINYLAISGVLSKLGRRGETPLPPLNLAADFSGGSLICVIGILMALVDRQSSGKGQLIDSAMVDGVSYLSSFLHTSQPLGIWSGERGTNLLDSGAPFYETYRTADGKYMSVGAIEPKFYRDLLRGLELEKDDLPAQMDQSKWEETKQKLATVFAGKTQKEWTDIFKDLDACVEPVLDFIEARNHPHNKQREMFVEIRPGVYEPAPAPKLSRTPGTVSPQEELIPGQDTREVLARLGYTQEEVLEFLREGVVEESGARASKL